VLHPEPDWRYVLKPEFRAGETIRVPAPDWRGYWDYEDSDGNECEVVPLMIEWLSRQKPAVWHAFVRDYMNWDMSAAIGVWIANQPACDRATAARLLFLNEPIYHYQNPDYANGDTDPMLSVSRNWTKGWYRDSSIEDDVSDYQGSIDAWQNFIQAVPSGQRHFDIDASLVGPFKGQEAGFPSSETPVVNPTMWAMIERLGVWVPHFEYLAFHQKVEQARKGWQQQLKELPWLQKVKFDFQKAYELGPCLNSMDELDSYIEGNAEVKNLVLCRAQGL
jgi:Domain of unknown function (DUF4274)